MGKEAIDVGGFVGVKQGRIVFGKHALHAVDRNGVTVGQVNDVLQNGPVSWARTSRQIFLSEPTDGLPKPLQASDVFFDDFSIHVIPSYDRVNNGAALTTTLLAIGSPTLGVSASVGM